MIGWVTSNPPGQGYSPASTTFTLATTAPHGREPNFFLDFSFTRRKECWYFQICSRFGVWMVRSERLRASTTVRSCVYGVCVYVPRNVKCTENGTTVCTRPESALWRITRFDSNMYQEETAIHSIPDANYMHTHSRVPCPIGFIKHQRAGGGTKLS